jgi:hypothetical protein
MKIKNIITAWLALLFLAASAAAQTGGSFTITQSVLAGGGQSATGDNFRLDGTIGQSLAGNALNNAPFAVTSGFWNFSPIAPTAATVGVGGRVKTAHGSGIQNVIVTLTDLSGTVRSTRTGSFGRYKFDGVAVGETYIFGVLAKRYTFSQPTIVRSIFDEIADLEFIADEQ